MNDTTLDRSGMERLRGLARGVAVVTILIVAALVATPG
jgi:hypothetical protein